jgi:hypothetical protein
LKRLSISSMGAFLGGMVREFSEENRKHGGDGNVFSSLAG